MIAVENVEAVEVVPLRAIAAVRHGFFTRNGGGSNGLYQSNNCAFGSSDDAASVKHNRELCARRLGMNVLVTVKQRHTADVVTVEQPWSWEAAPVADALVTRKPGIALGILTADCAPILFADAAAGVIAAAHAGWRGAFDDVIANTVAAMERMGAHRNHIVAAVGPCIGQPSYEVGPEFISRFTDRDPSFGTYFTAPKADGHAHFDLPRFVHDRALAAGVGNVSVEGSDTCAVDARFFSYRRSVLRGEPDYGRQLSAIGLAA